MACGMCLQKHTNDEIEGKYNPFDCDWFRFNSNSSLSVHCDEPLSSITLKKNNETKLKLMVAFGVKHSDFSEEFTKFKASHPNILQRLNLLVTCVCIARANRYTKLATCIGCCLAFTILEHESSEMEDEIGGPNLAAWLMKRVNMHFFKMSRLEIKTGNIVVQSVGLAVPVLIDCGKMDAHPRSPWIWAPCIDLIFPEFKLPANEKFLEDCKEIKLGEDIFDDIVFHTIPLGNCNTITSEDQIEVVVKRLDRTRQSEYEICQRIRSNRLCLNVAKLYHIPRAEVIDPKVVIGPKKKSENPLRYKYLFVEKLGETLKCATGQNQNKALQDCLQVAIGLGYLHGNGLLHHDVKPNNFMSIVVNDISVLKAIDFGSSTLVDEKGKILYSPHDPHDTFGTYEFRDPDGFNEYEFKNDDGKRMLRTSKKLDVYSFGKLLYYLVVGVPEVSPKKFRKQVDSLNKSSHLNELIRDCVEKDWSLRPEFTGDDGIVEILLDIMQAQECELALKYLCCSAHLARGAFKDRLVRPDCSCCGVN
eukprot:TRINITY_DN6945_c0_g2_i5.p1 TRINITY_DN6945_c0_g2~~TRINITY_DN6945_c0_g2_i5.p1  ORF type:complete len:532 (+),score=99.55 TRINITY_DN6945_c0_g2_i5:110-1705(+)